jgi:general secretion pathway protein D
MNLSRDNPPFQRDKLKTQVLLLLLLLLLILPFKAYPQTIAEKKASLQESGGELSSDAEKFLTQVNLELAEARLEEQKLMVQAKRLFGENAPEDSYIPLIVKMKELRSQISQLQESWREMITSQGKQEDYALWYQPETTLEQLIIDYGSQDYVYLMKPEIGSMKISVDSNLPIPRASWNEMLELILMENGVGIRQLNPFLRELFLLRNDRSSIKIITNRREDLELFSPESRVAFVLSPEPSDVRRIWFFLDNFANPDSTTVQLVGRDILLIARVSDIQDLLKLYEFVSENKGDKEYRAVVLSKVKAEDMAKVLGSVFNQPAQEPNRMFRPQENGKQRDLGREAKNGPEANGLQVLLLGSQTGALFLIGTREEVRKAEELIREIEGQIGGARDKVVYWYQVKHSDAIETAEVLSKVYDLMVSTGAGYENMERRGMQAGFGMPQEGGGSASASNAATGPIEQRTTIESPAPSIIPQIFPPDIYSRDPFFQYPRDPYFQQPIPPISPAFVFPATSANAPRPIDQGNFIVDIKTSSIIMVVETDLLPKLKSLLRKIDVPKKMVQIEVLLFEKKIAKQNTYGLNLLKFGSAASNITGASALFNIADSNGIATGIFDFLWSHKATCNTPAFDLNYRFLISQDDVTINASPSVLTVNQTPAFISIQEEISVNTGIVELPTVGGITLKDAFQRAQYGITLKITPSIHSSDDQERNETITLDSDITFDTFDTVNIPVNGTPNVTRRNIKNLARVADGETVIIGGLRRKTQEDTIDSIPFLGEIPGIGKLFSDTTMLDGSTEMFIFITPKIITDPACDLEWIRREEMLRRPGDLPEFMYALIEAEECEKNRLFETWMTTLFGRETREFYTPGWMNPDTCGGDAGYGGGEYDGRTCEYGYGGSDGG